MNQTQNDLHEPNINYDTLNRKDKLYFTRMMPRLGYYEIHDVSVATIHKEDETDKPYCTVCDLKTKQSFLMSKKYAEQVLFKDRDKALKYLKEQKVNCNKSYDDLTDDLAE